MDKQDYIEEIIDCDIEIERQFRQIEDIYKDIRADMVKRDGWLKALKDNFNK